MKSDLKPYICTQCGGRVNRATLVCEMCGTQFKDDSGGAGVIKIDVVRPGVRTLVQSREVPREMIYSMPPHDFSEMILRSMAKELADNIIPFMDVQTAEDPIRGAMYVRSRIRVLDPTYRF